MSDLSHLSDAELMQMAQQHMALPSAPQTPANAVPQQMNPLQGRMGIRGMRAGQGAGDLLPNMAHSFGNLGYDVGGGVTDAAAKVFPPEIAGGMGYVANVATDVVPSLLGGGATAAARPVGQEAGRRLMSSALKPTLENLRTGKAAQAIETMLEGGYNATKGGVEAMRKEAAALGDQVAEAIASSSATVNKGEVGLRLKETLDKFRQQVNPQADIEALRKAWTDFKNHPDLLGKMDIPVQLAQALKQGTYRALGSKPYGEMQGAATEAQKALARGLKEEISTAVPAVAPLNKAEGKLLNAVEIAERRALMQGNNNLAGQALLAKNPEAGIGFMADKSSLFKSLLARALYSRSAASTPGMLAGGLVGARSSQPEEP